PDDLGVCSEGALSLDRRPQERKTLLQASANPVRLVRLLRAAIDRAEHRVEQEEVVMKRMLTVRVAFHERVRTGVAAPADDLGKLWTQCWLSPAAEPDSPYLDLVLFDRPHDGVHGLDREIVRRPFATQETRIEALQARWTPERAWKGRFHMQVPDPVDAAERPYTLPLN